MSRIVNIQQLPNYYAQGGNLAEAADSGRIDMRMTFGRNVSLAVATCRPGYHPAPQVHASEQINYVSEGEIWVYVDGRAYLLKAGDAIRIPKMKIHWMWNRSERDCVFFESNCPPLAGDEAVRESRSALFDDGEPRESVHPKISWLSAKYARDLEEADPAASEGPLVARADSLQTSVHSGAIGASASGKLTSKCVHGLHHNMTIARRKGGYHSMPHMHDAEQLHYVVQGDIAVFTTEEGFACKPGDFNIVAPNIPHWSIVPEGEDNILLQAHTPVLGSAAQRKALIADEEGGLPVPVIYNMTPWRAEDLVRLEDRHLSQMRSA